MTHAHTSTPYQPQLLLPGQEAAPEGPIDMTAMYVMHHGFRRDLSRFTTAVAATPVEDLQTWQALAARWRVFAEILHHHHSAEDAGVWPALVARADLAELAHLEALEAEHAHIDPLLDSVADGLAALAEPTPTDDVEHRRVALSAHVRAARDLLSDHLAHEERDAIPIIQRLLTPQEWAAIEKGHFRQKPGSAGLRFLVSWFFEGIPQGQVGAVVGSVGVPVKVLWWLSRGSFRRSEHRVFPNAG